MGGGKGGGGKGLRGEGGAETKGNKLTQKLWKRLFNQKLKFSGNVCFRAETKGPRKTGANKDFLETLVFRQRLSETNVFSEIRQKSECFSLLEIAASHPPHPLFEPKWNGRLTILGWDFGLLVAYADGDMGAGFRVAGCSC